MNGPLASHETSSGLGLLGVAQVDHTEGNAHHYRCMRQVSPVLRPRSGIAGRLGTNAGVRSGEEQTGVEQDRIKRWDSDVGGILTAATESSPAAESHFSLTPASDRRASPVSLGSSPKMPFPTKTREDIPKKKIISIATISGESSPAGFESRSIALQSTFGERHSQPDISPGATLSCRSGAPSLSSSHRPDIFVTCGRGPTFDLPSLGPKLSSRRTLGTPGVTPATLAFHHSTPHIPLSRTPSPSHSTHSMDAFSPSPTPPSLLYDLYPPPSPGPLPSPQCSHPHHKRQRSDSTSGSANEKLL